MQQAQIYNYLVRFFSATGCTLRPGSESGTLKVKLTEEMDQLLMNRPFYWHYIHQTGLVAETKTLELRTNKQATQGELMYLGSPRLQHIFDTAEQLGRFIRLFQSDLPKQAAALEPWIGLTMKISYHCDLMRSRIASIGLQLINGTLIDGFSDMTKRLTLQPKLPDYCYTLRSLITVKSGIQRINHYLMQQLSEEDNQWAEDSAKRWQRDQQLLDSFYERELKKPDSYFQESDALRRQYEPHIDVRLVNASFYFLQSASFLPEAN
ncbi:MAG: YqhG family protein [Sporolactobacillus sp.]